MTLKEFYRQMYIELAREAIADATRARAGDIRFPHAYYMEDAAYYRVKAMEAMG